jgi:hypothetical protein
LTEAAAETPEATRLLLEACEYSGTEACTIRVVVAQHGLLTGKIRSTGVCILLAVVILRIYPLVWYYMVHDEMKRHSNQGLGGGVALLLAFFIGIVMPYITSSEVGSLYERAGLRRPVSGATGLWYFPGTLLIVGPHVWFVKTNGALNSYWRSLGAR